MAPAGDAPDPAGMAGSKASARSKGVPLGDPIKTIDAQLAANRKRFDELEHYEATCSIDVLNRCGPTLLKVQEELQRERDDLLARRVRLKFGLPESDEGVPAPTSKATAAVEQRLTKVEKAQADIAKRFDGLAAELSPLIAGLVQRSFEAALGPLKAEVAQLSGASAGGMRFAGVWQRALPYAAGSVVTHDGSGWVALKAVAPGVLPGADTASWQLFVKRGRDAVAPSERRAPVKLESPR